MSKWVNSLLDEIRQSTENEEFDSVVGISDTELIKFINQGNNRLHSKIVALHKQYFTEEKTVSAVSGQESYSLFYNSYLKNYIHSIEYSRTGNADNYYPLRPTSPHNRFTGADGMPERYFVRAGKFYLLPTPTSAGGSFRVTHIRRPYSLDKRRGQIVTSGYDSVSAPTYIDISFVNGQTEDLAFMRKGPYLSIVDQYGVLKIGNIKYSSITVGAGTGDARITLALDADLDVISNLSDGDYVVSGDYTSTHLEWTPQLDRYLQLFGEFKVLKRDSSVDSTEARNELLEMEADILEGFSEMSDDIVEIPEINDTEDWGI